MYRRQSGMSYQAVVGKLQIIQFAFAEHRKRIMSVSEYTVKNLALVSSVWVYPETAIQQKAQANPLKPKRTIKWLQPAKQWLDKIEVSSPKLAHRLCQAIPAQCPFERDVKLFGRTLFHIPPMCKLNPLYDEVVALRFRALCYLADECGEDITAYC
jgi:hypothetical protein